MCANVNFRGPRCGYLRRARPRGYDAIRIRDRSKPYECAQLPSTCRRFPRAASGIRRRELTLLDLTDYLYQIITTSKSDPN